MRRAIVAMCTLVVLALMVSVGTFAQGTLGSITGTVTDSSGAVVGDAEVKILNLGTGQEQTVKTKKDGSFSAEELSIGAYSVTFARDGFKTEVHSRILVQGDRTTTVNSTLVPGEVSVTVTVTGTPLMNQTDTTIGYVVDRLTIDDTPLGTGSFTQLAILSPGVHADFLGGAGSNAGLGNQAIFADGNRDTSNSFSLNGVSTNNLFNGNSASQVGENR
jgi:carboxypeptidase family protein